MHPIFIETPYIIISRVMSSDIGAMFIETPYSFPVIYVFILGLIVDF